jgi:putative drug exporter of the RND superfamily
VTRRLYLIAHWCANHAIWVVLAWVAFILVINGLNNRLAPAGQQEISLEGTDSATAQTLLNRAFPGVSSDAQPLVIGCSTSLDTPEGKRLLKDEETSLESINGVASVTGPAQESDLLSPDKETAILQVQVTSAYLGETKTADQILDTGKQQAPDCQVALGGLMGQSISSADTRSSEVIGLIAAVIVLLLTLRRFAAATIPLINAIMAVGCGSAIIAILGRLVYIPDVAPTLGTMLGLGVGIDYALFLVVRHRALLRKGFEVRDSIGRTAGTAGAGMVFAGSTLILAVCGLALTGISFLAWLGYAAAIVVAVAIASSLTLVPAIFSLMKMRVLPRKDKRAHHTTDEHLDAGFWARIADAVAARPWPFAIGAILILLIMAFPITKMEFGQSDASSLPPETTAYQANALTVEAFGPGYTGPLAVVVQMNRPATAPKHVQTQSGVDPRTLDPRLTSLEDTLEVTPGIEEVGSAVVSPDGGVAVIRVIPTTGPADPATQTLVDDLRTEILPPATEGQDMEAHVGGLTALMMDLTTQVGASLPRFIGGVVILSGFLLMLAYRSIVIPVKAAAMNLLSISAAYGVVVAVFQFGWGAQLIGVDTLVPIESYVPMMMFAVLFGLSMDYEVFLLTSFQEHWSRTKDMTVSVRRGLTDTGQVVTSAATIMVVVFASFILVPSTVVKMFGVGLATAVFVDATLVRCVLVPALMVLAAKVTWWLPRWIDRGLPHLRVEGDPATLATIHDPPPPDRPETVDEAITPATPLIPVLFGVVISWIIGSRMFPTNPDIPYQDVAVIVSAIVGGLVVWLPVGMPGVGRAPAARILSALCGAIGVALIFALIRAFIPFTNQNQGQMAAWAMLVVAALAAFTKMKKYGLPLVMGGIVMAVTLAVAGDPEAGLGSFMQIAIVPLFLSGFVTLVIQRFVIMVTPQEPAEAEEAPQPPPEAEAEVEPEPDLAGAPR